MSARTLFAFLIALWVAVATPQTRVVAGTSTRFAPAGTTAPQNGATWDVIRGATVYASSTTPNGWACFYPDASGRIVLTPPNTASLGSDLTVRTSQGTSPASALIDVVANIPAGRTVSYTALDTDLPANGAVWDVRRASTIVATDTVPDGWVVSRVGSVIAIKPPLNAALSNAYRVRYAFSPTDRKSFDFGVVPAGIDVNGAPIPPYAESAIPYDESSSSSPGPSAASMVDAASGVFVHEPEPDIEVYNAIGPAVDYQRSYRTSNVARNIQSPGLPLGWTDSWDFRIQATSPSSWLDLSLLHPNGSSETFTPTLSGGNPTGAFSHPNGAPYVLTGTPSGTVGLWTTLQWRQKDLSVWEFTHTAGGLYRLTRITTPYGFISIDRDGSGRPTFIRDSAGAALLTFTYISGILSQLTDFDGNYVKFFTGTMGGTTVFTQATYLAASTVTGPTPRWVYAYQSTPVGPLMNFCRAPRPLETYQLAQSMVTYDPFSQRVVETEDANGATRAYSYTATQTLVTTVRGAFSESYTLKYNNGRHTGTIDGLGRHDYINYQSATNPYKPTALVDRLAATTSITYDAYGNLLTSTNPRGITETFTYNFTPSAVGVLGSHQIEGRTSTTFEYDGVGRLLRVNSPRPGTSNTGDRVMAVEYAYTTMGNVASIRRLKPNGNYVCEVFHHTLTENGNPTTELLDRPGQSSLRDDNASGAVLRGPWKYAYDSLGRTIRWTNPVGALHKWSYNTRGQVASYEQPLIGTGTRTTTITYSVTGAPLQQVEREGGTPVATYQLDRSLESDAVAGLGLFPNVGATKDSLYRVRSLSQPDPNAPGQMMTRTVDLDPAGHLQKVTRPGGGQYTVNTTNGEGEATQTTDEVGQVRTITRATDDGRVLSVQYTGLPNETVTYGYDDYSRVTLITEEHGTIAYTYDDLDNVMTKTYTFTGGPGPLALTYTYAMDGSLDTLNTPRGLIDYRFNVLGEVDRVALGVGQGSVTYLYDDAGRVTEHKSPRYRITYDYDLRDRLIDQTTWFRQSLTETLGAKYNQFSYDPFDNVEAVRVTRPSISGTSLKHASGNWSISYDARFNRNVESYDFDTLPDDFTYSTPHDTGDRQASSRGLSLNLNKDGHPTGSGFTYDSRGVASQYDGIALTSDVDGHPTNYNGVLTTANWSSGERVWELGAGGQKIYHMYSGSLRICEIQQSGAAYAAYIYGPTGLAMRHKTVDVGGNYRDLAFDIFGNISFQTEAGEPQNRPSIYAFFDSLGQRVFEGLTSGAAYSPADPVGAFAQWGALQDEELQSSVRGFVTMSDGSLTYDPKTGKYIQASDLPLSAHEIDQIPMVVIGGLLDWDQSDTGNAKLNKLSNASVWLGDKTREFLSIPGMAGMAFGGVRAVKTPWQRGNAYLQRLGLQQNTQRIRSPLGFRKDRIPDWMDKHSNAPRWLQRSVTANANDVLLVEAKNVKRISRTRQLRDYIELGRLGQGVPVLITPHRTRIGRKLAKEIAAGNIQHVRRF